MLNMQYVNDTENYEVSFDIISRNIVQVKGNMPVKTNGFILTRIGNPEAFTGDYSDYTTVYKEVDGGVQFSNDGSVYVEPVPVVSFSTNGGGALDGETVQEVKRYEDLVIPTPVAYEDYEFTQWSPGIPVIGDVEGSKTFVAIFTSTLPVPDPEPTLEERVAVVEEDIQKINNALGGKTDGAY